MAVPRTWRLDRTAFATVVTFLVVATSWAQTHARPRMATQIPPEITTRFKVETPIGTLEFFDGYPSKGAVQK